MNSPIAEVVKSIVESYVEGVDAGVDLEHRKIAAVHAAYALALKDPHARIPSYLEAAIEASKGAPLEEAEIDERRGVSHTEYAVKGSWLSVIAALKSLFVNYHPMGYGTHVHSIGMENDGSYSARVSRSNSCD